MSERIELPELARRESEQIEWKENVADVNDVVATLSAFANDLQNLGTGYVVCGAREEKDEHGFPRLVRAGLTAARLKELEGTVLTRCRERVSPPITPLVDEVETDDPARRILVFTQPATGAAVLRASRLAGHDVSTQRTARHRSQDRKMMGEDKRTRRSDRRPGAGPSGLGTGV